MKTNIIKQALLMLSLVISSTALFGQVSQGGIPYSLQKDLKNTSGERAALSKKIVRIDMHSILNREIDAIRENNALQKLSQKFAYTFEVDIDLKEAATVDLLDIGRLYRLSIKSEDARSLNLIFKKYVLPKGAKLYLYSSDLKDIKGSFSAYNNKISERLATLPIKGEEIIIEYFEPYYTTIESKLVIGKVNHDFVGVVSRSGSIEDSFGSSGPCQVDINCSEGDSFQVIKRAVCRIIFEGDSYCTGTLMNNTNKDGRPLFLTANHCICSQEIADDCIFIFNYESPTCGGVDGSTDQSISGGTIRATRTQSDFTLLELSLTPLSSYDPHYAGWDRNNTQPQGGVGIHHPFGDVKKIATHNMIPVTSDCLESSVGGIGCGSNFFPNNNFWKIHPWLATSITHHDVTQNKSSGSPLFNSNHHVIGQLIGAFNCADGGCSDPSNDFANYGKIWASWDLGGTAGTQLQNWLDPNNDNPLSFDGSDICGEGILEHLTLTNTDISGTTKLRQVTETINSTSTIESGANIIYRAGEMISLNPGFSAVAGSVFLAEIVPLDCVPGCYSIKVPQLPNRFTPNGDGIEDELCYTATNATSYEVQINTIGGALVFSNSGPVIDGQVCVWDATGACQNCAYIVTITFRNECSEYSQTHRVIVSAGNRFARTNNTTQIQPNAQNLEHNSSDFDFEVYPNPNSGQFSIQINSTEFEVYSLDVINSMGVSVHRVEQLNTSTTTINPSNLLPGVYYIRLNNKDNIITKKMIVR